MKPRIKVFVTKNLKFRAKIDDGVAPPYEVTVGGKEWGSGKGISYRDTIAEKCFSILSSLTNQTKSI